MASRTGGRRTGGSRTGGSRTGGSLGAIRRVLARRNARIFYAGSLTSWTGLWMQRVATDWLAWQLTHSPLWVGVMAFCNLGPSVIASPIAGAVADRFDRVRMTMITQLISATHAAVLVTLILTGLIRIELMAGLEVCLGLAQAFSQPARQCLVPGIVPRAELPSAVALNSLCFNMARFVGPALSGPLVALFGVVPPIALNCGAYLFASLTMPLLRLPPEARVGHAATASVWREAADGIAYVARHGGMGPLMLFAAAIGMLMRSVPEMLSPFIAQLFSRGAEGLAAIASVMGLAALAGGMLVAVRGRLAGLTGMAVAAGLALVAATVGFVATPSFHLAIGCAAAMGAATTVHGIAIQTLLQNAAAPHMIGRVLSLWGMIVRAAPALGALAYGAASIAAGLRAPVMAGGCLCVLAWLWARARLPRMERELEAVRAGS